MKDQMTRAEVEVELDKTLRRHRIVERYINNTTDRDKGWAQLWREVLLDSKGPFLVQTVNLSDGLDVYVVGLYPSYDEAKAAFIQTINDNREEPLDDESIDEALDGGWYDIGAVHVVLLDLSNSI